MYKCKDTGEEVKTYQEYLLTTHWKDFKTKKYKSKVKYRCVCCETHKGLQLHHNTYEKIGCERLGDVVWLCTSCHATVHQVAKEKPDMDIKQVIARVKRLYQLNAL